MPKPHIPEHNSRQNSSLVEQTLRVPGRAALLSVSEGGEQTLRIFIVEQGG
jgi:hypothetical protein